MAGRRLSVIDRHRSASPAVDARTAVVTGRNPMGRIWWFLLALPVAACSASGEQDMVACHSQALRMYPHNSGPYSTRLDSYEKACMAARGYRFSAASADCGRGDLYEDAACYRAENAI
jgi:hypothetical protein